MFLHQRQSLVDIAAGRTRAALMRPGGIAGHEQLRHFQRQCLPLIPADQVQNQIKGGHRAGTGDAVAVDYVSLAHGVDVGKPFCEACQLLPMNRRAVPVQQARQSQQPASGVQPGQRVITFGRRPQPSLRLPVAMGAKPIRRHHHQGVAVGGLQRAMRCHLQARG